MGEEYSIRINEDGEVSSTREERQPERKKRVDNLIALVNDMDSPPGPIKRLIAAELTELYKLMIDQGDEQTLLEGFKIKALAEQVKTLRELGKELTEADVMSKKDFLNFDGPKLRYVLEQYREAAYEAMKETGLDEGTINSVTKHWRDILLSRDVEIRRTTEKIEFKKD
jgi:hypothetical protein